MIPSSMKVTFSIGIENILRPGFNKWAKVDY